MVLGGGGRFLMSEVPLYWLSLVAGGEDAAALQGVFIAYRGHRARGEALAPQLERLITSVFYRDTSLIRKRPSPGPYSRPERRAVKWSSGVGNFV